MILLLDGLSALGLAGNGTAFEMSPLTSRFLGSRQRVSKVFQIRHSL